MQTIHLLRKIKIAAGKTSSTPDERLEAIRELVKTAAKPAKRKRADRDHDRGDPGGLNRSS